MGGKEDGEFKLLLIVIYLSGLDHTWYVGVTAYRDYREWFKQPLLFNSTIVLRTQELKNKI